MASIKCVAGKSEDVKRNQKMMRSCDGRLTREVGSAAVGFMPKLKGQVLNCGAGGHSKRRLKDPSVNQLAIFE